MQIWVHASIFVPFGYITCYLGNTYDSIMLACTRAANLRSHCEVGYVGTGIVSNLDTFPWYLVAVPRVCAREADSGELRRVWRAAASSMVVQHHELKSCAICM